MALGKISVINFLNQLDCMHNIRIKLNVQHVMSCGKIALSANSTMGGGTLFKVGGAQMQINNYNFCGLNCQLWRHKHWNM